MSANSSIEWTQATWNPTVGCAKVSPGCDNCYAIRQAVRHDRVGSAYEGTTKRVDDQGRPFAGVGARIDWSGLVRTLPERLQQPFRWREPRLVFVDSMSDLFHTDVPAEYIAAVWNVMAMTPQHTYQILTKRPGRMRHLLAQRIWRDCNGDYHANTFDHTDTGTEKPAPLPNVWLGVSVENQHYADTRIPELIRTPAAVRFLSCEPLLGPVSLVHAMCSGAERGHGLTMSRVHAGGCCAHSVSRLDWVIVGGESGPGARPMVLGWAKEIVQQCKDAGVAAFVKQLGAHPTNREGVAHPVTDRKGGDPDEWPEDLRVREMPAGVR